MFIVLGEVVGDARQPRVHVGAAQFLGRHFFAGGGLHQRRTAEKDGAGPLDDDRLVGHRRHVGAARRAGAHDDGDLWNPLGRHARLVEEDAAEVLAVGEDLRLQGEEGAAGVDEIEARQPVLEGDLLCPQVLLDRDRIVGAALDRGIVGDDQHFAARDATDARDDSRARRVVVIHARGGERREFEEGCTAVEQPFDPLSHRKLAQGAVAFEILGATAVAVAIGARAKLVDEAAHPLLVGLEDRIRGIDARLESLHLPAAAVGLVTAGGAAPHCVHAVHLGAAAFAGDLVVGSWRRNLEGSDGPHGHAGRRLVGHRRDYRTWTIRLRHARGWWTSRLHHAAWLTPACSRPCAPCRDMNSSSIPIGSSPTPIARCRSGRDKRSRSPTWLR